MSGKFNCYLCKNSEFSVIADQDQMRFNCFGFKKYVAKCSECGLVQLYPVWKDEELKDLYSKYSQKKDFTGHKRKEIRSYYLERMIKGSVFVLEVGCGLGENLYRLRAKGYNAIGIDRDPTVCDGKTVFNYDFKDFSSDKKFDFIYAIHVFEHINDPKQFIEWIGNNLKEKGRFLLELPNSDDPLMTFYKNKNFSKFYWYPYHAYFYNKKILERMLKNLNGIEVKIILLQRYGLINHLRWVIFNRPGNFNNNIPLLDNIYKFVLTRIFKVSDSIVITGNKK